MKPAPFTYHRPLSVDDALETLQDVAPSGGRVLAGGQSLVPMMALRVIQPPHLVDINRIAELHGTATDGATLVIRALVRHAELASPGVAGPLGLVLARVARHIAHGPIRQRGTCCGSLAHADPASEWCLVATTLSATLEVRSRARRRRIDAAEFFLGAMSTALEPDELLTSIVFPMPASDHRFGFYEYSRRAGDFALGMALVSFALREGRISEPRVGIGAIEACPRRIAQAEAELTGATPSTAVFARAGAAAGSMVEALDDPQVPAAYRRKLTQVVVVRALENAMQGNMGFPPVGDRDS